MDHPVEHSPNGSGHEHSEVSVRMLVVSLFTLLVGTFLVCLLVIAIFKYFHTVNRVEQTAKEAQQQIPPEPRVEERPYEQLVTVRAREERILNSYAWVDKKEGTVRIPVSQAIDELAKKGLPSHDYMQDILAGKKPPAPKAQGTTNVAK
jgi:hypothetical protein